MGQLHGEEEEAVEEEEFAAYIVDSGAVVDLLKVWSFLWTLAAWIQLPLYYDGLFLLELFL